MELKTARLTLLIDPNKKAAFERLCATQDRTPSQVVRQFIRDYLARHGVTYVASGTGAPDTDAGGKNRPRSTGKEARPVAPGAAPRAPRRR
jgi:predicted transcriptional regulator